MRAGDGDAPSKAGPQRVFGLATSKHVHRLLLLLQHLGKHQIVDLVAQRAPVVSALDRARTSAAVSLVLLSFLGFKMSSLMLDCDAAGGKSARGVIFVVNRSRWKQDGA